MKCLHSSIDWKSRMCRDCYEVFDEEESEWDKTLESIGIDPNKPLTLADQEEESE